ncbi:MAG: 3-isopropylmalate dehydrogenase [Alphaproteobacteria bacterium]|nr:3-isopropylmalate dehydrogenase [Alphaproteobacteria bacterium]
MAFNLLVLPGDGIGTEVVGAALQVVERLRDNHGWQVVVSQDLIGGAACNHHGVPLAPETKDRATAADAVLLGAVGGPDFDHLPLNKRPEQGLLQLRQAMGVYANLRPARVFPSLVQASSLKPELVSDLDILMVRELTGGLYFGQPRGFEDLGDGNRRGFNTQTYTNLEIVRVARVAFRLAQQRGKKLCSIDKANVLESGRLWRDEVSKLGAAEYPDVALTHMYVDNAAMQLVRAPKQFDVILTDNMFGDILSDEAAQLTGSLGMLPSASLGDVVAGRPHQPGLYEPIHGSAPDIAGQDRANPLATILSLAMLLRFSAGQPALADRIEQAVATLLADGARTQDLAAAGEVAIGTQEMTARLLKLL